MSGKKGFFIFTGMGVMSNLHVDSLWAENHLCDYLIMGSPLFPGACIHLRDASSEPVSCPGYSAIQPALG